MSDRVTDELQFDRVVTAKGSAPAGAVICAGCHASIETEYYDVNGNTVCDACRQAIESAADTPQGIGPFAISGLFGFGAAVAGAAIYYAVIALADLEIGLIAILCGYMVGYSVRKGAGGRGGLRFQILAIVLTYLSVALAYTPVLIMQMRQPDAQTAPAEDTAATSAAGTRTAPPAGEAASGQGVPTPEEPVSAVLAVAVLAGFILALPIIVVVGSLPSGLITVAIIGFGMHQAWKMTGAPTVRTLGPYRVGGTQAASA